MSDDQATSCLAACECSICGVQEISELYHSPDGKFYAYHGVLPDGLDVVELFYDKTFYASPVVQNELMIFQTADSPHIPKLLGTFEDQASDRIVAVLDTGFVGTTVRMEVSSTSSMEDEGASIVIDAMMNVREELHRLGLAISCFPSWAIMHQGSSTVMYSFQSTVPLCVRTERMELHMLSKLVREMMPWIDDVKPHRDEMLLQTGVNVMSMCEYYIGPILVKSELHSNNDRTQCVYHGVLPDGHDVIVLFYDKTFYESTAVKNELEFFSRANSPYIPKRLYTFEDVDADGMIEVLDAGFVGHTVRRQTMGDMRMSDSAAEGVVLSLRVVREELHRLGLAISCFPSWSIMHKGSSSAMYCFQYIVPFSAAAERNESRAFAQFIKEMMHWSNIPANALSPAEMSILTLYRTLVGNDNFGRALRRAGTDTDLVNHLGHLASRYCLIDNDSSGWDAAL